MLSGWDDTRLDQRGKSVQKKKVVRDTVQYRCSVLYHKSNNQGMTHCWFRAQADQTEQSAHIIFGCRKKAEAVSPNLHVQAPSPRNCIGVEVSKALMSR